MQGQRCIGKELALIRATRRNENERALALIEIPGIDLEFSGENENGRTVLHVASEKGSVTIMEALIAKGANINVRDKQERTPLHAAIAMGQKESVACLLAQKACEVNARDFVGFTPLIAASFLNKATIVDDLILHGADPKIATHVANAHADNRSTCPAVGRTALHEASFRGFIEVANSLLTAGADVDGRDCQGASPLHLAAKKGQAATVQLLIPKGATVDLRSLGHNTPLHQAASEGHKDVALCLLDHGADVDAVDKNGITALSFATQLKHLALVDLLLQQGADPSIGRYNPSSEVNGQAPLHYASGYGLLEITDRLLEGGADVNQVDSQAATPLIMAAQSGHIKVVKRLVSSGAHLHLSNNRGINSLQSASFYNRSEVVDYLIKKGADFDNQGNALVKACKCCGATNLPLKKCSGCGVVWYCSPDCQKRDWRDGGESCHKIQCPRVKEQRRLYKEKKKEELEGETHEIYERLKRERDSEASSSQGVDP